MAGESESAIFSARLAHAQALEAAGVNLYPAESPKRTYPNAELEECFVELQGKDVIVTGRMTNKRVHGGVTFSDIEDESGSVQAMFRKSQLGPELYRLIVDYFDIGDFIGVKGALDKTRSGEVTVFADACTMLTKALRMSPHKLLDPERHQRQRYLHTLVDPEARKRFRMRSQIVQYMRNYFIDRMGCLEVETPVLDTTYGGASAKPFTTHMNALGETMYLRIANELYLKRYTVGGFYEGVFEFSRDFRNEGVDRTHNPEFTQVELYKPFWDYRDMMDMTEDLVSGLVGKIHGTTRIPYGEFMIDYKRPWRRLTVYGGLKEKLGIDPATISLEDLRSIAGSYGIEAEGRGKIMLELFEKLWENSLMDPTFVLDYPKETSALTKVHRDNPELVERFEVYAGGMEVGNCYTELNDPRDQRTRFEAEKARKLAGDQEAMPFDEDFITALEYGMPIQAGIGLSIDRWTMLLTNANHIRQVIYFPTLKPKGQDVAGS